MKGKKKYKFIDLFAGIGGFYQAFKNLAKKENFDIECVFSSEIDKEAIKVYSYNYKKKPNDIINIKLLDENASQVAEHDILFAGFPCQTFSNAGKKMGFEDEIRGTLFFDIVKILKHKKPKYFLLENVKHLVRHNNGETWKTIQNILKNELKYKILDKPLILSPHKFGIPQIRERIFIPGILEEKIENKNQTFEFNFENLYKNTIDTEKFLEKVIDDKYYLNDKYLENVLLAWGEFVKNVEFPKDKTLPVIWLDEISKRYDVSHLPLWHQKYLNNMWELFDNNKKFIINWMDKHKVFLWKKRERKFEWQVGKNCKNINESFIQLRQSGIRCKKATSFPTLVAIVQTPLLFDKIKQKWRFLTPREAANIQSFPIHFKLHNQIVKESNDYFSYKQLGNSVNIYLVFLILEKLLRYK